MSWSQLFTDEARRPAQPGVRFGTAALLLLIFSFLCWWALTGTMKNWDSVWAYRSAFWRGWVLTLGLSAASLVLSSLIGVLAALARRSELLLLRYPAIAYIELVRGLPLLVLLLLLFYGVANAVGVENRIVVGILGLSLFSGAYMAEIVRAGIESVGQTQWESARAIGLNTSQTYRYVVFPQALRQILPPLAGQFASLIKDSSLLSILGIAEFTFSAQQINSATLSTMESYFPLGIGYLVLTIPISLWSKNLEAKLRYER